jgi:hypothetical protein
LLGAAFTYKSGGGGGGGAGIGKALIEFPSGVARVTHGSDAEIQAEVRIKLKPDQDSPQDLKVTFEAVILQDPNRSPGREPDDLINIQMLDSTSGKIIASGAPAAVPLKLFGDKWVKLRATSSRYTADWITELRVTVE